MMLDMILLNATATTGDAGAGGLLSLAPMVIIIGGMFFLMNRQEKKRKREAQEILDSLEIGDEIVTIGGIVARVARIEEKTETVLVETGPDRSKLRIQRGAIGTNTTEVERREVAAEKAKAERTAKKSK